MSNTQSQSNQPLESPSSESLQEPADVKPDKPIGENSDDAQADDVGKLIVIHFSRLILL
jgi:hypothetical protein